MLRTLRFKSVAIDEHTSAIAPTATHVKVCGNTILMRTMFETCQNIRSLRLYNIKEVPDCRDTCIEELIIRECPLQNSLRIGASMQELEIDGVNTLSELFTDSVIRLRTLTVKRCYGLLLCFGTDDNPIGLKELKLIGNDNMRLPSIPTSVTELTIAYCDRIIDIPFKRTLLHRIRLAGFPLIKVLSLTQFSQLIAVHLYGFDLLESVNFPDAVKDVQVNVLCMPKVCISATNTIESRAWDLNASDVILRDADYANTQTPAL